MKIRDLLINLLKHDIDLDVFLINGSDLVSPAVVVEAIVKPHALRSVGLPLKIYDAELVGNMEDIIGHQTGEPHINRQTKPNALFITWI